MPQVREGGNRHPKKVGQALIVSPAIPGKAGIRVLSLDGGGMRAGSLLTILQSLEDAMGLPLAAVFDVIVGTGVGGLVALGVGQDMSSDELFKLSDTLQDSLFQRPPLEKGML